MGNRISVQYTKFVNIDKFGVEESTSYGFRVYDDYAKGYDNTYPTLENLNNLVNKDTILDLVESIEGFEDAGEYPIYLNDVLVNGNDEDEDDPGDGWG